jgi:hypothetical protein
MQFNQINAQTGLNLTQQEYDQALYSTTRGQNQISAKVSAGDYDGANQLLQNAGLAPIDFTKVKAGETRQVISDIQGIIDNLGPDADPNVITALSGLQTTVMSQAWKALGIDSATSTITNADGTTTTVADLLKNIDNPTEPQTVQTIAKMTSSTEDFLNTPEGDTAIEQLAESSAWNGLYERATAGDEAAATEMGRVFGAARALQAHMTDQLNLPRARDKGAPRKYGIWREAEPDAATITSKTDVITDKLKWQVCRSGGDLQCHDRCGEKAVGTFDELSTGALDSRAKTIVDSQDFAQLSKLKTDDPLYKAVLGKMTSASFGYKNNALKNDTFTNAPAVGTWIKYKTPDGEKIIKVTYSGYVNTSGSSDRAYMEFEDTEGNVYSTSGDNTTLRRGKETKYSIK